MLKISLVFFRNLQKNFWKTSRDMKINILADFQICISVPLNSTTESVCMSQNHRHQK